MLGQLIYHMDFARVGVLIVGDNVEAWLDRVMREVMNKIAIKEPARALLAEAYKELWRSQGGDWRAVEKMSGLPFRKTCLDCEHLAMGLRCDIHKGAPPSEYLKHKSCEDWQGVPF